VPLAVSLGVLAFTWLRATRGAAALPWFVAAHWKLCASRYRLLLIGYGVVVDLVRDRVGADIVTAFLNSLTAECWTVIESGRGIAPEVQENGTGRSSFHSP